MVVVMVLDHREGEGGAVRGRRSSEKKVRVVEWWKKEKEKEKEVWDGNVERRRLEWQRGERS